MEGKGSAGTSAKKKGARGSKASRRVVSVSKGRRPGDRMLTKAHVVANPGKSIGTMPAEKLAISFAAPLAADVRLAAAQQTDGNVSAWLAEAAREQLRQMHLKAAIEAYEAEHGVITEDELAEIRKGWPR